jgi:membrane-associated phospholipid phosphatase
MNRLHRFFQPLHLGLAVYSILTAFIPVFFQINLANPLAFYGIRILILLLIGIWPLIKLRLNKRWVQFFDLLLGTVFLGFFYNETGQLNAIAGSPIDPLLINAEQFLFRSQPSVLFSQVLTGLFATELMYLGYLSFYFIVFGFLLFLFIKKSDQFNRLLFLIVQSFLIFYLIFILVPSWGPQFYFFSPINQAPEGVFFQKIVSFIQITGESKTGAFPSSHVGMTFIVLLLSFRYAKVYGWIILPLAILLFCSTVYIKAHYLVDVVGGFIIAPVLLVISEKTWTLLKPKNEYDGDYS